ncbi:MAG TPA: nitroreductase family protein [Candidatus Binatia bacterium]|jgi:nitroreductase|nr:nitroreductase family protein [Candidatus Binatia bacterium]
MAIPEHDARLFDIMWTTRAMRRLKPDPVPDDVLRQLVDAALHGPSGSNAQNWRFVIVRDRAQKERMRAIWQRTWSFYLETFATAEPRPGEDITVRERTLLAGTWQLDHFVEIPAFVCVCVARDEAVAKVLASASTLTKAVRHFGLGGAIRLMTSGGRTSGLADGSTAYPAVQNLLLAARALGLGAVLTTQHFFVPGEFEAVLGIPKTATLAAIIPVGWPTGKFGPTHRPDPNSVTSWDRW